MTDKKSFSTYVAEFKTEYKYVLKFAINEMTDSMVDSLEACLAKYNLIHASAFRKTPIQESPLDFPNIKNTSVYICDMSMGYPGSIDFLRTYICSSMGISPACLAVYSENDPRQIETDLYVDRSSAEYKEKYKTRLGSDYEDADSDLETEPVKYNTSFLQALETVRKEQKVNTVENPLSQSAKTDHSTLPNGYDGFNDPKNLKTDPAGFFGRIKKANLLKTGAV